MAAIGQARPATAGAGIRTPLFILGVALALISFLAMFAFGILFANRVPAVGTVRVVVAAQDIQPREPITADMITTGSVPASAVPPRVFTRLSDLNGFAALVVIYKGQALTANMVASNPDQLATAGASSYLPIPQGYVAITLPTGEQQGVAGYITQGDYIDIIATVNTSLLSPTSNHTVARTVFINVHVIRVGPPSLAPKQGQVQGVASSLTVVVSLCDAQYLEWLIQNAALKYVLLSYHDYATVVAASDPACPSTTEPGIVGPAQVEARWGFTKG